MENAKRVVSLDVEKEIEKLLSKMSIREKLGQCIMIEPCFCMAELNETIEKEGKGEKYTDILDPKFLDKLLNDYHIGLFLYGGVSRIGDDSPEAWTDYLIKVDEYVDKTKLKIPMLYGADAVHGVNFIKGSTIFPHNLGVSATWNPSLVEAYAEVVGDELLAIGINCNFAPTVDVARDQRWGRVYESLGEDPFLASVMSESLIKGMQANGNVAATAKHFVGYGESNNGMDRTPADLSDRSLHETHLPPFEAAIKNNVQAIMVNGGDVNGIPMPASKRLITDLLRKKMGFKGVTMSDWEDVYRLYSRHKTVKSRKEGIEKAFNAGLDMNMAVSDLKAVDLMEELVEEGRILMERVDEAAGNVLRVKFNLGLFNKEPLDRDKSMLMSGSEKSKRIAKQIVLESITLLKNKNGLLPLSKKLKSILVTGAKADSKRHMCGGWTLSWASAKEEDLFCKTVLEGLKEKVSSETVITYVQDVEQFEKLNGANKNFDVCISIVGEEPHSEWLGDSMSMEMEEEEKLMLRAVVKNGLPVVMVSLIGRPQQLIWANDHIDAIVWAYLPGTEGAEPIADVLFGDYNPSGKTSITFPKDANQIPVVYDARRYECYEITTKYEPLYPFGHGLSYTVFEYRELLIPEEVPVGQGLEVSIKVKNSGNFKGQAVVQCYLKDMYASITRPLKSLKAFEKVMLNPGEERTVILKLSSKELSLYDEYLELVEEKREIEVQIGDQSKKFRLV